MSDITCKLCGLKRAKWFSLARHIKQVHIKSGDVSSLADYYEKFCDWDGVKTCSCGNDLNFYTLQTGYQPHCSHKCADADPAVRRKKVEHAQQTLVDRYGVTNMSQVPGSRKKAKQSKLLRHGDENYNNVQKNKETCLSRYGKTSATWLPAYAEKYRKTVHEKYGVDHHTQAECVKQHARETSLATYGVDHPWKSPDVLAKREHTITERYGGYTLASPELSAKMQQTMLERYGVTHPAFSPECQERRRQTSLARYGVEYPVQNRDILHKIQSSQHNSFKRREFVCGDCTVNVQSKPEISFVESCIKQGLSVCDGPTIKYVHDGHKRCYTVDFLLETPAGTRLIEIKQKHGWYFRELASGKLVAKVRAAQQYSRDRGMLPFKLVFL